MLKNKTINELLDVIEEAERHLSEEHCFCTFYNKDIIGAGLEALRRLRECANVIEGDDEGGFVVSE